MKRLLNTLYVTTQGAYLAREGETVKVRVEHETKLRVPLHTLGGIVCFGQVSCSPPLMGYCAERGVGLAFLSEYGRFLARVQGPVSGNVLLRRAQYRAADNEKKKAQIARVIVLAKCANSRHVLLRTARDCASDSTKARLQEAARHIARVINGVENAQSVDTIRGMEGDAARCYFEVFDHLIVAQKDELVFRTRTRRPPRDPINALLSFVYTLLAHDLRSALEVVGLDPAVGYLHADRPGRPSLALDLMEEFRACLADRLVLSLINRRQVRPSGFRSTESGAVSMDDKTRKEILIAYQNRKQEAIEHPFTGEKVPIGLLPHVQAQLMARHLRGDQESYAPFFWK